MIKPDGNSPVYRITYEDCKKMVSHMEDTFRSDVFGVEAELNGYSIGSVITPAYHRGLILRNLQTPAEIVL